MTCYVYRVTKLIRIKICCATILQKSYKIIGRTREVEPYMLKSYLNILRFVFEHVC
ncbi:hypothetical protein HanRHA438_Chr12g0575951 [Helianthus annuus]|nr:hypothetical protein HanRHA438_Chr12g0575951 [Helianthus annuus]